MAFGEEVLGRRVEIAFDDAGDWYAGTIEEMKTKLKGEHFVRLHFVRFDDGDKRWLNLAEEEESAQLRWPPSSGKRAGPSTASMVNPPSKKPQVSKSLAPQATTPAPTPTPTMERKVAVPVPEPERKVAPAVIEPERKVPEPERKVPEPECKVAPPEPTSTFEMPVVKSIDDIIRYMDRIEPGRGYYKKQEDNRGGCSKTRKKLRTFADRNPTHPAVASWVNTNSWTPPNQTSLNAIVQLLKTMI